MTTQTGDKSLEQLHSEVSDLEKSLNELKTATLSGAERKKKESEVKNKADRLQGQIDVLSGQEGIDAKIVAEKERAELLLKNCTDTLSLQSSIGNTPTDKTKSDNKEKPVQTISSETKPAATGTDKQNSNPEDEKKGFFGKAKDWVGEQWDDVWSKEKWQQEGGKNLLRTAGFVATGVGAVTLAYKGVKKLWNRAFGDDDEEEETKESESKSDKKKDKKSFWDGAVGKTIKTVGSILAVGSVGYYVAHGIYTQNRGLNDIRDREKGKKMGFDEALNYSKGIGNNKDEKHMAYGMELNYDESTQEIIAYGERIKINKNARKIVGMDVNFKKYEDMICTAILIAYLKKEYSGKCDVAAPFSLGSSWNGNINADGETAVNGTGIGRRTSLAAAGGIAGIAAGIFSGSVPVGVVSTLGLGGAGYIGGQQIDQNNVMHNFMPELDNEHGKKSLIGYLNNLNCWQKRNQNAEELTQSPIRDEAYACVQSIESEDGQGDRRGGERKFDAVPDPNNSNRYIFEAYGRKINVEVTGEQGNRKVKILGMMEEGNPSVKVNQDLIKNFGEMSLDEGVRTVCLIGMYLKDYNHRIKKLPAFEYKSVLGAKTGLYLNDGKNAGVGTRVLREDTFKNKFPTLFTKKDEFVKFLNEGINGDNNVSIRKE